MHEQQHDARVLHNLTYVEVKVVGYVGKVQCASLTAAAEVGMALESEAVASAVREAEFEHMQREAAEAGIASLQDELEKLRQKLKSAQVGLPSWIMSLFELIGIGYLTAP